MTTTRSSDPPKIPVICGPTAAGKTSVGVAISKALDGEVVSADSRQFYREMFIGTARPSIEEMDGVPHHFVDHCSISAPITAGEFERAGTEKTMDILDRGKLPIVVGGSGLFIRALMEGLDELPFDDNLRQELIQEFEVSGLGSLLARLSKSDPDAAGSIDSQNQVRVMRAIELVELSGKSLAKVRNQEKPAPSFEPVWIGISPQREKLYERIDSRVDQMMKAGLEDEALALLPFRDSDALKTVGYKELFGYFDGSYDLDEAVRLIKRNSRRYAKRQLTWFRKIDGIKWFEPGQIVEITSYTRYQLTQK